MRITFYTSNPSEPSIKRYTQHRKHLIRYNCHSDFFFSPSYVTKFEQKKFHSILQILKQVKSDDIVMDGCRSRFCQHGVILKMTKISPVFGHH